MRGTAPSAAVDRPGHCGQIDAALRDSWTLGTVWHDAVAPRRNRAGVIGRRSALERASPAMITCAHRDQVRAVPPRTDGCEECLRAGERWVHLRLCLTCGHVGCSDSSRGRHATRHFEAAGHPLMRSAESGETWAWCYVDRQGFETADVAPFDAERSETAEPQSARPFVDALYREFLARGVEYFLPGTRLEVIEPEVMSDPSGAVEFEWLGSRYRLSADEHRFSADQARLLQGIRRVLSARYHILFDAALAAQSLHLFRGLPEDRFVSAFLDPAAYADVEASTRVRDRVSEAIEVLRLSTLTTHENRRIETGVLLFGSTPDPCHVLPSRPPGALPYSSGLTAIRSFHRLCDGLKTLALVNQDGLLVEVVDVHQWAAPYADLPLPVPTIGRYRAHSRATLCGGHICLVLTPNGEIKIFAEGAQLFGFRDGRWRLTDTRERYGVWRRALGDDQMAELLFTVALDLAEDRRGALFVILDDAAAARQLLSSGDLLTSIEGPAISGSKQQLHYLLREKDLLHIAPAVLESVARIDGAIVFDTAGRLLAFGTILRHPGAADPALAAAEGGRTTAAFGASLFGKVLMVSEDGGISFMHHGRRIWQL